MFYSFKLAFSMMQVLSHLAMARPPHASCKQWPAIGADAYLWEHTDVIGVAWRFFKPKHRSLPSFPFVRAHGILIYYITSNPKAFVQADYQWADYLCYYSCLGCSYIGRGTVIFLTGVSILAIQILTPGRRTITRKNVATSLITRQ